MYNPKYYRLPWDKEKTDLLIKYWPHYGTYGMVHILDGISRKQIKAKVNKLKLVLLPKNQRLCVLCKNRYQLGVRSSGLKCKECYLLKRKDLRSCKEYSLIEWVKEMARSARYRSRTMHNIISDIDDLFLIALLKKQEGLCYYSKQTLDFPKFKKDRNHLSASIDRIDSSKGYTKDNIVWCAWGCNAGKNKFSYETYYNLCKAVVENKVKEQGLE